MSGKKTAFTGGKELFFNITSQGKMYEFFGVKSDRQFMKFISDKEKSTGLEPKDFVDIIYFALQWKDKTVTKEVAEELINQYLEDETTEPNLSMLIYETLANSGIIPMASFKKMKEMREMTEEKLDEYLKNFIKNQEEDKGELVKMSNSPSGSNGLKETSSDSIMDTSNQDSS
jgi:hypothetical protein